MRQRGYRAAVLVAVLVLGVGLAGCRSDGDAAREPTGDAGGASAVDASAGGGAEAPLVFPGKDWEKVSPESQGLSAARLNEAMKVVAEIAEDHKDGTKSAGNSQCVVVRNGYLVWAGRDIDNMHSVHSCGKSFLSATLGLLVDDDKCTLETRAAKSLPALGEKYPGVTLRHFASLTSGYRVPWRESAFEIRDPMHEPGQGFHYSASPNQLANIMTRIAGEPLRNLFKRRIADPIGIPEVDWYWRDLGKIDGRVVCGGAGHMSITARQFARFGLLLLAKGRWGDKQVLSEWWVDQSTGVQVAADVDSYDPKAWYIHLPGRYGYLFWVNGTNKRGERLWPSAPPNTFAAQGNRNNYCFVIPEWRMVFVRMGQGKAIDHALYDRVFAKLRAAFKD